MKWGIVIGLNGSVIRVRGIYVLLDLLRVSDYV